MIHAFSDMNIFLVFMRSECYKWVRLSLSEISHCSKISNSFIGRGFELCCFNLIKKSTEYSFVALNTFRVGFKHNQCLSHSIFPLPAPVIITCTRPNLQIGQIFYFRGNCGWVEKAAVLKWESQVSLYYAVIFQSVTGQNSEPLIVSDACPLLHEYGPKHCLVSTEGLIQTYYLCNDIVEFCITVCVDGY